MERFGRYVLIERLGQGGMGEVHLAQRDGADRSCVLKLLRVEHRSNANQLSRLKREAHLLSYLDHPHVAHILDAGVEDGVFYLALEHIDGFTLRKILKRFEARGRPMPIGAALSVALSVLEGLVYAHTLKGPDGNPLDVVHRDLSPNNIMLTAAGQVKIIDFGLASAKVDRFQTVPGVILGTFRYSAPEQVETGHVDMRSDLYTVGATLYEMLTGHPVVETRDATKVLQAVLTARPRPLHELVPELPESVWLVVGSALAKDPEDRPHSAREFADRLRVAARDLPIFSPQLLGQTIASVTDPNRDTAATWSSAPETLTAETTASEVSAPSGASATKELAPEPVRSNKKLPWLAVALLCAAIMPLSFVAVRAALRRGSVTAEDELARFEREIRKMLAEGRCRDASEAMSVRAEDRLASRNALEIERMLYDASTAGECHKFDGILARQIDLERNR